MPHSHAMKYGYYNADTGELWVGKTVDGQQSHGAAMSVGTFSSFADAAAYALTKGVKL